MPSSLLTSNKNKVFDALLKQKGINVRQTETIPRCEKADAYPVSFAQQRLWFLDQLEPGKALYNLPAAVRLSGQLDTSALSRSFDEMVRRHDSLRTTFTSVDGQPRQVIAEPAALPLPLIDLTGLGVSEREAEVARLVGEEARRPFDLAAGPLLRAKLLRLGNDEHVLLLNMHHIISDGWSLGVLVREVTNLYATYAAGREPQLPELPLQYADYAVWQQRWLQGPTLEEQLSYWRKQLAGIPSALELPTDRPRPAEQSYRGASTSFSLPESITQELRRLARNEDVTPFMLLSAAFKVLLHRYTNQTDIVIGTPIANRKRPELEGLIGFFVNTLVLRTDLSGDPTFHQLLAREREVCLGAYANQDAPFERLVEELQPDRSSGHSPLFQVAFILQNTPAEQLSSSEMDGLRVILMGGSATQTAKFDLTLNIEEGNDGLSAAMEYSTELFDVSTVERMTGHFVRLVESIVSDPGCAISRLELLTEVERRQVLFDFNDVVADYPRESCLQELFEAQVEHLPEAVALVHQNEQLTYRELNERANRLAHYLLARGVGSDTLVGLQLSRSVDMVVALLGVMKAGGAYVALDAAWPPARLRFMLEDAQIGVLLTTERLQPREVPLGVKVISLDTERERIAAESPHNPACHAAPDNLAYVAYTSGSTGTPKGVAVPQQAVIRLVKGANYVELGADEVMLQYAPLAFDASTFEIWGSLLNGARLVIASDGVLSIEELGQVIREQRVTTLWLTAGLFHRMVDQRLEDLRGVRQLLAGGDVLSVRHVIKVVTELPGCKLINGYGPTENTTFTCCHAVTEESGLHRSVPIGQAIPGTQVYLLDSNLRPVPIGVAGELYVGGDGLARGYLNRPELTAQRFIPHPFNTGGERLYRTGDVARYLPNGVVEFLGRADLQIKLRGFRIELGEIEAVLNTHEAVQSAVVVAREVEANEKILVAYVVAQPLQSPSTSELYVYLRERLPEYMVPQAFLVLDELPLMPNGKVDRHKLPAPEQSWPTLAGEYIAPRTPVEEILAAIWEEVLARKTVSVHDNFFELGGHSLLATQVISRVRDAFGQEVALRSLFEQPTVAGLAREIEAGGGLRADLQAPPLERVERAERLPLSFAQQRLWFLDQMEPGSASYNIPAAVRLRGVLNVEALERTLSEVVRRHEVLRTHFMAVDGEPVQVIEPAAPIKLEVFDLSMLDEVERTAETERLVAEESARPFDLSRGPLLRMSLLRLGEDEHVALVMMHHIISDGWSIGVLVREVAALYSAYVRGEESPLEELPIQYADFAHWQRNWLQGDVLAAQLDYWHDELDGAPAFIDLPIDKPRPPVQTHRGAHHPLRLSPELSSQLKDLSRQNGSTLFMTLLAAFDLLLSRYAGQEQVLVGSPIANRNRSETEGLIGFFVNTLVLRGDVHGNPSFRELLRRVRETALGAYAHQDLPFEKLVEELQPERDMSRSPLFQVMFVLQNAPGEALQLEGLSLSRVESASDTVKFELMLGLEEVGETVAGGFNYNRDLYEPETIGRLVESYERVLQAVVADAEQRVFEIELLSENERRQIIHGWNETAAADPRESLLSELFETQVACTPEAVALRFEDTAYTYRELNERSNQLAHYLQRSGVSPDVLVGILMHRSMEMIVAVLGILKAGGAYVPLDPSYPRERLAFMVQDAELRILLTQAELLNEVPGDYVGQTLSLDQQWDAIAGEGVENLLSVAHPESLAYVIYTSGSTGRPKGVMIQQRSVVHLATALQQSIYQQYGAGLRIGLSAPLAFDASVKQVVQLLHGHTLCILPEEARADARQLLDYIKRYRLDSLDCTPSHLKLLGPDGVAELLALRPQLVLVGGEALDETVWPQLADSQETRFFNIYGPTECTVDATVSAVRAALPASTIGRPLPNVQVYVLDQRQQPVGIGIAGEIYIGGDGVGRGYLQQPGLTAERFIPHPYCAEEGARLYRTGDVGRYLIDGNIEYLGRLDDQVKLRGFRIELGEIQAVLASHPAVREAAVVLRDKSGDKRLVAYVAAEETTDAVLRDYLRERVPEYMVPTAFVRLEHLPLTPNGKVDRRALPAPDAMSLVLGSGFVAPRTPVEELVASIWSQVLDVERIGVADNFFELGGHSLLATQVISRVRETFGQEVALRSLFEQPTVAGLALTIERAQRAEAGLSAPPLVPISRDAELPLSFAQQRLWFLDQLGPGSVAYNIPAAVRLKGRLDVEALRCTLSEVVRRHEVLRTTFTAVNGEAAQVIAPASQVELTVLDLSELPEEQRESEARRLAAVEAQQPFDLSVGPLLRTQLLQFGAEDHVVLFTMHHIITDGWSTGILVREVSALYEAYIEGRESPLPELEIQYADYAVWQREWLQGEVLEQQLSYWRQQLGELPVLQLPTDKPRPPVQSDRGRSLHFSLPASLTAELKKLSTAEGVTLYMTLLGAFKILLWRYSGQSDVVVGTPIAGRNHLATEGLIGLFVNTLVLRTSLSGDPSLSELLDRVREVTLGAYAHQDLPFEKLVEELQPERDMSRSPLCQAVFALHNQTTETLQLPGLETSAVRSAVDETVKFDMTMAFTEIEGELNGSLQYSTDLFEASTISRMLEQFERLLASAVSVPEQHISQLELLSSAERQQLLVERNETHVAYPHSRGIHELFEEQVALAPDEPALTFDGQHLSYDELNSRANQLAHYLRQLGVNAETPVGVCLNRSIEMVVAILATLKAGGVYIPLDPEYPAERLAFILEDVFPPVILTDSSLVDEMPSSWAQMICLDTESELWSALPTTDMGDFVSSGDNLAYVMYTSGSTGNPKGVAVPHRAVVRLVKQSAYVDFGPSEVFLQLAPVTFDASTLEIWGALLNGGRLVLAPPGAPNLAELGSLLRSEGVTVLWLTAGLFHLMVEQELEALAGVTQVVAGGDVLSVEHVRRLLRAKGGSGVVVNGYGPTETTTFACCHRMSGETELEHGVPIGSPIGNTQVYVLSEEMELLGDGMLGELYIGGDGLARCYHNQPELTAERFVPHPFSTTGGERLYRTGDYVSWRADGTLEFIGRRDTQVKIRGFRVEPGEVEAVLGRHGAVKECAVVVRRESNGEKRLVAYVVNRNHEDGVSASELRDYLREQLPEFMLPGAIVAIESLPLTPNGKVDRRELAAREVHVAGVQSYVPPRTINEELLCNIWEEVLHVQRVGIDDNFFDLGGDSILTIQVIARANAVGLHLNVQQLFQYQTVHELAQELERSNESSIVEETAPFSVISEEDRLRLPAGVVDAYPVTALQAGMLFHSELAPEAGQYHDIFSYHLRMPFDEEALQAALRQLLELHPVLRTSFNLSDFSEPLQLVHEEVEAPLRIGDLRSLTPAEQKEHVAEWVAAEKRHHFDWRKAPLLRFQVARRDEESFQFSVSFHHAILDGWSLATMLTELFNVYASVLKGDEPRTNAPLSSSFRDFVAAEQAALNSAEAQQYWTGMLSDAPYSRLPRLGQSTGPSRIAGHSVDISGELSLALKALARTAGVPLKSVLLAAHLRALSVLTGSNDVLTGMVSHGRPETADGERVLGLFLNTLPFRRRLPGGTWLQLVQETFAAERELLPFRRYPMARMQQDLGNDTPLFEITFNFTHFHAYEEMQHPGDLEVLGIYGVADTNFTLTVDFSLDLAGSQVGLHFHYDTAELSAEQIEAVGRNYLTILESMTRRPLERYEHQSLLSRAERQTILNDWNDTREAYDFDQCLQQLLEAQ